MRLPKKCFIFFLLLALSCSESKVEEHALVLDVNAWKVSTNEFAKQYCKTTKYLSPFNNVLEERKILEQVSNLVNGPFKGKSISKVKFSGDSFNIGNVNVSIVEGDSLGHQFVSADTLCNRLYYAYSYRLLPSDDDDQGCKFEENGQSVSIVIKFDRKMNYSVQCIGFY